jgi:hypothetical protein
MIFDAVVEPPRTRGMEAFDEVPECAPVCMPYQAGDVLDEYNPRPQAGDVGRDGFQDLVMRIGHVVVTVDQLAEAFARRSSSKEIEVSQPATISHHAVVTVLREEITLGCDGFRSVVIVGGYRRIPGIVGLHYANANGAEADPDCPHATAQLDTYGGV